MFVKQNSYFSMITMHSWMFLSSYVVLREKIITSQDIVNMNHLGARAFEEVGGEVVQTTAFVIRRSNIKDYFATYVRLVDYNSQHAKENAYFTDGSRYTVKKTVYFNIPGHPIAYWITTAMEKAFAYPNLYDITISDGQNKTGDNDTYLRKCWEVDSSTIGIGEKWLKYAKGGSYRKWYGNIDDIVNWSDEARRFYRKSPACRIVQEYLWYKVGITWGIIAQIGFRVLPTDATFDMQGSSIFLKNDNDIYYILAFLNSKVALSYLKVFNTTLSFQI